MIRPHSAAAVLCAGAALVAVLVATLVAGMSGTARAQSSFNSPTLEKIEARGEIRLAYREFAPPFSSAGPEGTPVGYSIELCNEVVDEIREEIGDPDLKVTWLPVNSKSRFLVTNQGLADMVCGSTSVTLSRMRVVDFSLITFATGARLLVKEDSTVKELKDIRIGAVGVQPNTTSAQALRKVIAVNRSSVRVVDVQHAEEALQKLDRGEIEAYVSDFVLLKGLEAAPKNSNKYKVVGDFLTYDPYALIVPRNDSKFRAVVNRRLARLFREQTIYKIHDRYFSGMRAAMSKLLVYSIAVQALPE